MSLDRIVLSLRHHVLVVVGRHLLESSRVFRSQFAEQVFHMTGVRSSAGVHRERKCGQDGHCADLMGRSHVDRYTLPNCGRTDRNLTPEGDQKQRRREAGRRSQSLDTQEVDEFPGGKQGHKTGKRAVVDLGDQFILSEVFPRGDV